jgi:hypothetical protein
MNKMNWKEKLEQAAKTKPWQDLRIGDKLLVRKHLSTFHNLPYGVAREMAKRRNTMVTIKTINNSTRETMPVLINIEEDTYNWSLQMFENYKDYKKG